MSVFLMVHNMANSCMHALQIMLLLICVDVVMMFAAFLRAPLLNVCLGMAAAAQTHATAKQCTGWTPTRQYPGHQ